MKTLKYKLYNSKKNKKLQSILFVCANIYNHCIALHKRYYKMTGTYLNANKLKNHITKLKHLDKYSFWNQVPSQSIQDITERIDRGYKLFFRNRKHKTRTAPPSFRKGIRYSSFTLKQAGYKFFNDNTVILSGKKYKYFQSRQIPINDIKTVIVKKDTVGDFYLYVTVKTSYVTPKVKRASGNSVAFDFGLTQFLTASDSQDVQSPLFFKKNLKKTRKLNRNLSRKMKGSNQRKKAKLELARHHRKIGNCRHDYHFKLANKLTDKYDEIFLETLNMKWMSSTYGRKVHDLGFSDFVQILQYKSEQKDVVCHCIDKYFPSTKMCSNCKMVNYDLKDVRIRSWVCPACGALHDRDRNASYNILNEGLVWLGRQPISRSVSNSVVSTV